MPRITPDPAAAPSDDVGVAVWTAVLTGVVTTAVVLWGSVGPALRLVRDHVTVPDPARPVGGLLPTGAAELRAWPLDGVTWLLTRAVPAGLVASALVVVAALAGGVGVGVLLRRHGPAAVVAGTVVATWNPHVAERLLVGQPAVLLGYACLPWVVLAARWDARRAARLPVILLAAAPAALTPWGGVVALVVALAATASRPGGRSRDVVLVGALGLVWCAPWLVPGLLAGGVGADPDGAAAFALADDTGGGTWLSALVGGGVWAPGGVPASRGTALALGCSLALLVAAAAGAVVLGRRDRRRGVLAAVLLVGPASALALASGPLLPVTTALQAVPGVALLRDEHRLLAPAVLVAAVLIGLLVEHLVHASGGRHRAVAGCLAASLAVALAVGSVPDLPSTLRSAYRPVELPPDWDATVRAASGGGTVLSLPWQPLRRPGWRGPGPAFLDPTPRAVAAPVLSSTVLTVVRDGRPVVVDDAPVADGADWARGAVSGASLRRHGVARVVEWLDTPGALPSARPGWVLLHDGPAFRVWDVTRAG